LQQHDTDVKDSKNLSPLHVHQWGKPWTTFFKIFELSTEQEEALIEAATALDSSLLKSNKCFTSIWKGVDDYIKSNGPVFVRLSTTSPKDTGDSLCCQKVEDVFNLLAKSFRILEDLESKELGSFSLAIRKWETKIKENNLYRCYLINGVCEAVAKMDDSSEPNKSNQVLIANYIKKTSIYVP